MISNGISADWTTDVLYIQLPDVGAANISFSTAEFVSRTTVPVSSRTSVVDGPDGDGVRETLRTGVSNDADYPTDAITATSAYDVRSSRTTR